MNTMIILVGELKLSFSIRGIKIVFSGNIYVCYEYYGFRFFCHIPFEIFSSHPILLNCLYCNTGNGSIIQNKHSNKSIFPLNTKH
ncbi:hypothetical protein XELAEV_18003306mg [Xenopus laevis]|uniref:Uncharacterized protein n=1 Tax=Xenopus laevis TaxID=8355 RepID=A0A974GYY6_XENLA|nr:hypothetical protein XELAEV_18003306mg [Xenopus laevis]